MPPLKILDNITSLLGDDLKSTLGPGARLRIAASCFSIYAYEALKTELEQIDALEFIFTSPTFLPNDVSDKLRKEHREFHIPKVERERSLYGSEFEVRLRNELTQKASFDLGWQNHPFKILPLPVALDLSALYDQIIRQYLPFPERSNECLRDHVARVLAIESKQREAAQLESRLGKEKQFNRRVELNRQLRDLSEAIGRLMDDFAAPPAHELQRRSQTAATSFS